MSWDRRSIRNLVVFVATLSLWSATPATATHNTYNNIYAGPKTWLPNYWEAGPYDAAYDRWYNNGIAGVNPSSGCSRLTLIDGGGGWHRTATYCGTWGIFEPNWRYFKKPYCQNISTFNFTAYCHGDRDWGHPD